jgi:hypothetical protein
LNYGHTRTFTFLRLMMEGMRRSPWIPN